MKLKVSGSGKHAFARVLARCPQCGKEAVFENVGERDTGIGNNFVCGQRKCPNPNCSGHLFVVLNSGKLIASYPAITLDFDTENIPKRIKETFEEALNCLAANCYIASAIMVRRTLEEVCEDKKAKGNNLKAKIKDLESKIVLPAELLEAMDELRLLGNDAAHIEAKQYDQITEIELDVAIEITKEIMKALYQYTNLLGKLRALKNGNA
ncbi:hypothetical protein A7E78_11040 [Syntrophotalea acetylenivorans]|uniref:DUF4145 domain-containing protein n=1 Tax=Syntrophotalea acetylenivorans TaxID=1842532 RepID=A0A1L3GQZ0_9BACT|nr:DUF4145 domain-containing protein [Syntrophotalea acetylenivorans]APG28337.1 hypothetical protein A7E78_11040 [Syntrophotalea acetylenivorans]